MAFKGFSEDNLTAISIPDQFFSQVLLEIDDLDELKLTLYIFWRLSHVEGPVNYLYFQELLEDPRFLQSLANDRESSPNTLENILMKAVSRGTLLQVDLADETKPDKLICLNSPKGRALLDAIRRGEWRETDRTHSFTDIYAEHPNIFHLYEVNIGPLTPMIADSLRDAEKTYPADWIEDAFHIAVERNKRSWHYIDAILHRWQEGGRDDQKDKQNRRDTEEARRRYGEWEK